MLLEEEEQIHHAAAGLLMLEAMSIDGSFFIELNYKTVC